MKNTKLIGFLILIALVLGGYGALRPASQTVVERVIDRALGAQATAVVDNDCLFDPNLGGHVCTYATPFAAATTTVCAVQSPITSTSTLLGAMSGLNITTGTSTATRVWQSKSATRFGATTTAQFNTATLAANLKGFIMATSSFNGGVASITTGTTGSTDLPLVFAPGTWIRAEIADGLVNGQGFAGNGACKYTFFY